MVLVNAFDYSISNSKSIEEILVQLLARSWFWRMPFPCQILIKKVLKTRFVQLLARSWFW